MIASPTFGPLASTMLVVAALAAAWSVTLLKVFGRTSKWTWYVDNTPSQFVTTGPKVVAIVLMAGTFLLVNKANFQIFLGVALLFAIAAFSILMRLDRLRRIHVHVVKEAVAGVGGRVLVIGTEENMLPAAEQAFASAKAKEPPLTLVEFMSGYGVTGLYNPEAIWPRSHLIGIAHHMAMLLTFAFLCGVVAVYVAASAITIASP
jgi:hypothetical protein